MSGDFIAVLEAASLPAGQNRGVEAGGEKILICHATDGNFYAVENLCSHAAGALEGGRMRGAKLICPLHGAGFDLRTGQPLSMPANEPIRIFPVKVEQGQVWVRVEKI